MADWLTVRDVAQLLAVDEKTVTRWARRDASMPCLRRGRVVRFRRDLLEAWLLRQLPRASRKHTGSTQEPSLSAIA